MINNIIGVIVSLLPLAIQVYLRHTSPEQMEARKKSQIQKLKVEIEYLRAKEDAITSKKCTPGHQHELAYVINSIVKLRKKVRDLEGK